MPESSQQMCTECGRPLLTLAANAQGEPYGRPELDGLTFGAENGTLTLRGRCRKCHKIQQIVNPAELLQAA